jgi:hypothetical protein
VSDKETAPWNLQHEANELLRNLDRVIFRGQLEMWKAPLAVALIEDFAGRVAVECTAQAPTQRGDSIVGRTADEPHRPLVCFVCANRFPVTFNFCLEHKDEYERLKAAATPQGTPDRTKEFLDKVWQKDEPTETTGLFPPNSSKNWQKEK